MKGNASVPVVKNLEHALSAMFPAGKMLIASPDEVARVVERIPHGRVLTLGALRRALAARFGADYTCPLTTGIFLRRAAEERIRTPIPYHRVVRDNGALLDKLPGGSEHQERLLRREGVVCGHQWKVPRVADLAAHAWEPRRPSKTVRA
jgi:alkylated DNA nucleotide flippase Atl1